MIFNSIQEIKAKIESPSNKSFLEEAEIIRKKLELHVCGIGLDEYIDKIQGIENQNAVSLRRALGKVITKPETSKIISVFNKIFSARGGGRFYNFESKNQETEFISKYLTNIRNGMSISTFMKKEWKELVNKDSNGILLAEINQDNQLFLSFKSSGSILDIDFVSPTQIEYIIFKPEIIKIGRDEVRKYRVIDDNYDYTVKFENNQYSIVLEESYKNPFGYVPGCFVSDRKAKDSDCFISHIDECLIYADDVLLDYTIYKVYKVKIGIPLHWQYQRQCSVCHGSGLITLNDEQTTCAKCGGKGYDNHNRDISEIIVLPLPENGDVPLTPPAGYVSGDLATWTQFENTIESNKQKMYTSVWGNSSSIDIDRRNITMGELAIRENSKEDKLNDISDNEESVEKFITDLFGKFYYQDSYKGSVIHNGRLFDIKTSEELMSEYKDSLISGVSTTKLNEILADYYYTVYKRNPKQLNESIIKLYTKPFFHWSPDKLQLYGINDSDYLKNLYYDEFATWYEINKEPLGISTIDKVNKALNEWIKQKELKKVEEPINNLENGTEFKSTGNI